VGPGPTHEWSIGGRGGAAEADLRGPGREFRTALEQHLSQARAEVERVFELLGEEPSAERCLGFEGLKAEHEKMVEEASDDLIDAVDLGAAGRTENYEIAAYEGLRRMAKAMGDEEALELLDSNLKEEKEALRTVDKIATRISNESANKAQPDRDRGAQSIADGNDRRAARRGSQRERGASFPRRAV